MMATKWYSIVVGVVLFVLGILLFGNFSVEGTAYAWLYLVVGFVGALLGFSEKGKNV